VFIKACYPLHGHFQYTGSAWRTARNSVQDPGSSTADYTLWGLAPALSSPVEGLSWRATLKGNRVLKMTVQGILQMILTVPCCCWVEKFTCIMHHTPMFSRFQCPRVLAGHNNS
jgi:hypothetical protein